MVIFIRKVKPKRQICEPCLKELANKACKLSFAKEEVELSCYGIIEEGLKKGLPPPSISSSFLKFIKEKTGFIDPFFEMKEREFESAIKAFENLSQNYNDLYGLLKLSALGNSWDYFTTGFRITDLLIDSMDKIEREIYIKKKAVLIIGDNMADFIFDRPLVAYLKKNREVFYMVKKEPIQNDLSISDIKYFGLHSSAEIIEGTDYVGISGQDLERILSEIGNVETIIAKGMANYETLSESNLKLPIIHIMKVKCEPVASSLGLKKESLIVKLMGEDHGL